VVGVSAEIVLDISCGGHTKTYNPPDVVERRLDSLRNVILAVELGQGRPVGFDTAATGSE